VQERRNRNAVYYENTKESLWRWFLRKKAKAIKAKKVFTLTYEWLEDEYNKCNGICPISGRAFLTGKKNKWFNLTIDQIVPGGGYTPENSRLMILWLNVVKSDMADEDFQRGLPDLLQALDCMILST
jgi:hypothetical protein